ncbi:hypothetical protein GOP47_0009427 [Adiantum capillus-veneris]|uniref:non-specific serine/threonine protein kinase n=1 Tax=Adiantum capillus-veneris TaxID=13818 RepID=A0A9D4UWR9_ADICA|nr:hypothetical protein GOP47_0009427 [Adiantum capillus-veneris]
MKNLLRRLHLAAPPEDPPDGAHPKGPKSRFSFSDALAPSSSAASDSKPFTGLSGLLSAAKQTLNQAGNFKQKKEGCVVVEQDHREDMDDPSVDRLERNELGPVTTERAGASIRTENAETLSKMGDDEQQFLVTNVASPSTSVTSRPSTQHKSLACTSSDSTLLAVDALLRGPPGIQRTQTAETTALQLASNQAVLLQDEELQVRVAMALSVRDDPEAATIETIKDATRGSDLQLLNSSAQLLAYRYWKYSALSYEDKIVDGFYDVYAVVPNLPSEMMPSLIVLQETPASNEVIWEAVLVNRAVDSDLVQLEQKAIALASSYGSVIATESKSGVINRIAELVADQMGGPVDNADLLLQNWKASSAALRLAVGNVVVPLGRLVVGLGRHRALLFKLSKFSKTARICQVLADAVGIPCQLIKGKQYAFDDESAMTVIKADSEREFIIDLMAVPGSLLPYDPSLIPSTNMAGKDFGSLQQSPNKAAKELSAEGVGGKEFQELPPTTKVFQVSRQQLKEVHAIPARPPNKSTMLRRSPSWTEGVGLPGARDTKVKDVSEYMINAAKDNPTLAQRLHDVLIESGVQAPPDLFTEKSRKQLQDQMSEEWKVDDESEKVKASRGGAIRRKQKSSVGPGRPASAAQSYSSSSEESCKERLRRLNSVEGLGDRRPLDFSFLNVSPSSSPNSSASSGAAVVQSTSPVLPAGALSLAHETLPSELIKGPVAAAAATAAVVASSMLVAATKSERVSDPALDVPVAVAATATAAVVAATTAVVGRRMELPISEPIKEEASGKGVRESLEQKHDEGTDYQGRNSQHSVSEGRGSGGADKNTEEERVSDKSTESVSARSDRLLHEVAKCEIHWDELVIGERIGLGSYGEVYHGDWHGTEVAVKKFLNQDISGDALLEFGSEVELMQRMRHPNVVLFMGAVMHPPNLSIVTEFLPRGSLYRLIHRSNSQIDERRRMRMALDVARGMNYLHNSSPVIVHRDLKSPNLLVDKNWVVKVCDFGLSRMKPNTFLSSKSTAGTPEWMAPEVLRNEPSNEKSDVYSFGVILWELATLQQPWASMNPMQVVGAVGFQHRTLDIPDNLDPIVVNVIRQCWQSDPTLRPSFAEIINTLKPLQKPITPSSVSKG